MDQSVTPAPSFARAAEIWVRDGDRLVNGGGDYGSLHDFAAASVARSFTKGEGLPGRAWDEGRPVLLNDLTAETFKRAGPANVAGLGAAVAVPVFAGRVLKAVLVLLCAAERGAGAIEIWAENQGRLSLADGFYGVARDFADISKDMTFGHGQGLPGGVWAARTPILMRDLSRGGFLRADGATRAGLKTGLGVPVHGPAGGVHVLTLLSAPSTPIASRFEIWDARPEKAGRGGGAVLVDGICSRDGALWNDDDPPRLTPWRGILGRVLATGQPTVESGARHLTEGYDRLVALPVHRGEELAHIVAIYS